jgi:hypothetical protein
MSRATITLHMTVALVVQSVLCATALVTAVVFRHSANRHSSRLLPRRHSDLFVVVLVMVAHHGIVRRPVFDVPDLVVPVQRWSGAAKSQAERSGFVEVRR